MSIHATHYTILGYDLSEKRSDMLNDKWLWSKTADEWTCNTSAGKIQLFTDPMDGNFLFFGYIVAAKDDEDDWTESIKIDEIVNKKVLVDQALLQLGLPIPKDLPNYKLICFTEWR